MKGPTELLLPLIEPARGDDLPLRRLHHLAEAAGVDESCAVRLARTFRSLQCVYAAAEPDLARVVGTVTAARLRWFLDAPLDGATASHLRAPSRAA